nr:MAG TPA: hypothetical protein [Caudoviricetes sp.]
MTAQPERLADKRISITGKGGHLESAALYPEKDLL